MVVKVGDRVQRRLKGSVKVVFLTRKKQGAFQANGSPWLSAIERKKIPKIKLYVLPVSIFPKRIRLNNHIPSSNVSSTKLHRLVNCALSSQKINKSKTVKQKKTNVRIYKTWVELLEEVVTNLLRILLSSTSTQTSVISPHEEKCFLNELSTSSPGSSVLYPITRILPMSLHETRLLPTWQEPTQSNRHKAINYFTVFLVWFS